jgi:2-keto-4-pentenoate hydratase
MTLSNVAIDGAATALVEARETGRRLSRLPAELRPQCHEDSCAISRRTAELLGESITGWKIGFGWDGRPSLGPVLSNLRFSTGSTINTPACPIVGVEGEIGLVVQRAFNKDDPQDIIDSVVVTPLIEIVSPRFLDIGRISPLEAAADCGVNGGVVTGPPSPVALLQDRPVTLGIELDGQQFAFAAQPARDPLDAVAWLGGVLASVGLELEPDQVVATGAITGLVKLGRASRVRVGIEHLGCVDFSIAPRHEML